MKQVICALSLIVLISAGVCIYIVPFVKEWVGYGENNYKKAVIVIISILVIARPLALIVCSIARLFFPDKTKRPELLI